MTCVIGIVVLATQLSGLTAGTRHSPEGVFSSEKHSFLIEKTPTTLCAPDASFDRKTTFSELATLGIVAFGKAESAAQICSTHFAANTSLPIAR
jgi:hypothetical protein